MKQGVAWRDIGVETGAGGMPRLRLTGKASERLAQLVPPDRKAVLHVTMTDDSPSAAAFVVIEAVIP